MFYRIRSYLKVDAMITLFYSIIYSILHYGILSWDSAKRSELGALSTCLNKIIKTDAFAKKLFPVTLIFKVLDILQIEDINQLELGKFMYQTFKGNIPHKIDEGFMKLSPVINIALDHWFSTGRPWPIPHKIDKDFMKLSFAINIH